MSDIVTRLRSTRSTMLGTEDEQHYMDCHEAVNLIMALIKELRTIYANDFWEPQEIDDRIEEILSGGVNSG